MSNQQDNLPEKYFNPADALRQLGGAERISLGRLLDVEAWVEFGADLIDRLEPEAAQPAIDDATAGRIAGYAREASNNADTLQAEAISKHTKAVDEHAEPGYDMLKKAGEDYQPLIPDQTPAAQAEMPTTYLHPDVMNALDSYGPGSNDNNLSGVN